MTLTDAVTGKRRDYWLGEHGSGGSREAYHRIVGEWESQGRRPPVAEAPAQARSDGAGSSGPTVDEALLAYWRSIGEGVGGKRSHAIRITLRLLRQFDGSTPVTQFGPRRLRMIRDAMIRGDEGATPPRRPWSRRTANDRVRIILAAFRLAASQELVPPSVPQSLSMLAPLKRGRSEATEDKRVLPVDLTVVRATMESVSRQVRALIDLQVLTGARPGELLQLRAADIDAAAAGGVWAYRPAQHKNSHRQIARTIYFGPDAQRIITEFMRNRAIERPLFGPQDAEDQRRAAAHARRRVPHGYGNSPGTNRSTSPARPAGKHYTTDSYRRAIQRACDLAFPPPERLRPRVLASGRSETHQQFEGQLTSKEREELRAWRETHRWHPHQLRHTAATRIRREFGLEAAQLVLGHAWAAITDAVYAERDLSKVAEVIRRVGWTRWAGPPTPAVPRT